MYEPEAKIMAEIAEGNLTAFSLVFYPADGAAKDRRYRYLQTFDDFPPESLSSVYLALIGGASR